MVGQSREAKMKRKVYIGCFTFLGILTGFFLHALIEVNLIPFLLKDFERNGLGLSWAAWENIHAYGTSLLVVFGGIYGFRQGKKWWNVLYVQQKYKKYLRKPLKAEF
jgi:hypothetical protein